MSHTNQPIPSFFVFYLYSSSNITSLSVSLSQRIEACIVVPCAQWMPLLLPVLFSDYEDEIRFSHTWRYCTQGGECLSLERNPRLHWVIKTFTFYLTTTCTWLIHIVSSSFVFRNTLHYITSIEAPAMRTCPERLFGCDASKQCMSYQWHLEGVARRSLDGRDAIIGILLSILSWFWCIWSDHQAAHSQ